MIIQHIGMGGNRGRRWGVIRGDDVQVNENG